MKKIHIETIYLIEEADGDKKTLSARTSQTIEKDGDWEALIERHEEKVGAIERNLLKSNE
jgi:hypothetical protein